MPRFATLFAFALVFAATACGTTTSYIPLNPAPRPLQPRSPDSVEIFLARMPERRYIEVGMLESQQSSEFSTDRKAEILADMRQIAASNGCDGVIITGPNDRVTTSTLSWLVLDRTDVETLEGLRGSCIVYVEPPPPSYVEPPLPGYVEPPPPDVAPALQTAAVSPAPEPRELTPCDKVHASIRAEPEPYRKLAIVRSSPSECFQGSE